MKSPSVATRRHWFDTVGLSAVLGLFVANAFHFNIYQTYAFYRELFGVLFIALSCWHFPTNATAPRGREFRRDRNIFLLFLFPILLLVWSSFDPGVQLYGESLEGVSEQLGGASQVLYVLRNALLYLPLVMYLYLRGVNLQEIRIVALVVVLVTPFSIVAYLRSGDLGEMGLALGDVIGLGGQGIAYNSYVPYLTFSVLCGLYLIFSPRIQLINMVVLSCTALTSIFILFSTSRQSVLFVLAAVATFFFLSSERGMLKNKWLTVGIAVGVATGFFLFLTQGVLVADNFLDRFSSVAGIVSDDRSRRIDVAIDGLAMLNPFEWLVGAGLTSVLESGPHNDYVRWTQRIGLPLMAFGFLPFILAFVQCFRLSRRYRAGNTLFIFLTLAVGFPLYHSLFGYPREDANQAVVVYLGLALWFGACREGLIPTLGGSTKRAVWRDNQVLSPAKKSLQDSAR
jgi:hypothetical protein